MTPSAIARRLPPGERRTQLVGTALGLFADHAEEDVGLEDIAAAAGVTRNLLYRYFDGKADLYRAAVSEAIVRLAGVMDLDPSRPLDEKLPANIARWLDALETGEPALRLLIRAGHSTDADVQQTSTTARALLVRSIAKNHLGDRRPSPALLAGLHGYLALCERLCASWLDEGEIDRADVERILVAALPPIVAAAS